MTCKIIKDDNGRPIGFQCGPDPKPTDHECDALGKFVELDTGMGKVHSATCSICGRPAFQMSDIW